MIIQTGTSGLWEIYVKHRDCENEHLYLSCLKNSDLKGFLNFEDVQHFIQLIQEQLNEENQ